MDEGLVVRREGFLVPAAVAALLSAPGGFDPQPVRQAAAEAFGAVGPLEFHLSSLGPGEGLSEVLPPAAAGGFALDLDPPQWRSEWGGLLLFQDGERLHGYRPVPGALTLYRAQAQPLISLVMLRAEPRVAFLGWWR